MVAVGLVAVMVVVAGITAAVVRRSRPVARAQVHVDDLVTGRVPSVCAITGEPTTHMVQVDSVRGGFQGWWLLLLFLGPIGIAAIAVLYVLGGRTDRVAGVLPITEAALARYNEAVDLARRATLALVTVVVLGFVGLSLSDGGRSDLALALAVIVGVALVVVLGASVVAPTRWVDLRLDGSGRWVTIERAHPGFAAAVRRSYQDRPSEIR